MGIPWMNKNCNTIMLLMLDSTVPEEMISGLHKYCSAFFFNCQVKVKRPGEIWQKKRLAADFCEENNITKREDQVNATEILSALEPLRSKDTFCVLGITNKDIYPDESYNFVFGLASLGKGTGVFSFCRHGSPENMN